MEIAVYNVFYILHDIVLSKYEKNAIKISNHRAETSTFPAQIADPVNKGRLSGFVMYIIRNTF